MGQAVYLVIHEVPHEKDFVIAVRSKKEDAEALAANLREKRAKPLYGECFEVYEYEIDGEVGTDYTV